MRKLKSHTSYIEEYNNIVIIMERLHNDINGHPKYRVQLVNLKEKNAYSDISNNQYFNLVSYAPLTDIKHYIDTHEISNWTE
jgi:hypothetical protein